VGHLNLAFDILLLASCGYAWRQGGAPERLVAGLFCAGVVATHLAFAPWAERWIGMENGALAVDLCLLAGLLLVAALAERYWTIWFAAFHLVGTAGHFVQAADAGLGRWQYAFPIAIWSYPMIALLVGGTWLHRRRVARGGHDPSWTAASPLPRPLACG
jgi:hypothetical protein